MAYIDPRHKALWHLDRVKELRTTGKTSAPVNVEIDLSNRCSLGCAWCHFAHTHTRGPLAGRAAKPTGAIAGGDLMEHDLALRILNELSAAGVQSVTWTGGGEPTLHPTFDAIVLHAHLVGLEQGLYTHGGHMTPARAALLKTAATWVYVSLDECTPEEYRASKGVDAFERALGGIRQLVEAEGPATVGVGFLLHTGNVGRVHDMVRLGRELGVDYVQFRPTIRYEQDAPGSPAETDMRWVPHAVGRLNAYRHDPFVIADTERFNLYATWQGHGYETCLWSALQTVITPNGKVWRCVNKREHPDALLGDLSIEGFDALWPRAGGACPVDAGCRVLCRGHIANLALTEALKEPAHAAFI
jgi:MoaA/NifB/PqqE/SkfB family radical SAM enzyme